MKLFIYAIVGSILLIALFSGATLALLAYDGIQHGKQYFIIPIVILFGFQVTGTVIDIINWLLRQALKALDIPVSES